MIVLGAAVWVAIAIAYALLTLLFLWMTVAVGRRMGFRTVASRLLVATLVGFAFAPGGCVGLYVPGTIQGVFKPRLVGSIPDAFAVSFVCAFLLTFVAFSVLSGRRLRRQHQDEARSDAADGPSPHC